MNEPPDDSEPTPERQAELMAWCERSRPGTSRRLGIHTRGELLWLMRAQGWSGEVDEPRHSRVRLIGASFYRANLRGVHLYLAGLMDSTFLEADLSGAILIGADLLDTSFNGATLEGAHLAGAYLTHATLCDANLRGANLVHADLSRALLRGADLSGADLFGADLTGADLSGADLRGADLRTRPRRFDERTKFSNVVADATTRWTWGMHPAREDTEQAEQG